MQKTYFLNVNCNGKDTIQFSCLLHEYEATEMLRAKEEGRKVIFNLFTKYGNNIDIHRFD